MPPQPPVPKSSRRVKEGTSKYTGVYFDKMLIDGMRKLSWMGNNGILVVMIMRRTLLLIMLEQYLSIERV